MAWTAVLTADHYDQLVSAMYARFLGDADSQPPETGPEDPVMVAAAQLALDLPGFDWTIEVDLLGHHRITLHFKGASVGIDE